MMKRPTLSILVLSILFNAVQAAENPNDRNVFPGAHDKANRFANLRVTDVTFSPDGKRLAASIYQHPMNRSGSDWGAFTVQWDLTTGKRIIVWDAVGPISFSPSGKMLAMGIYTRSREPGRRNWPQATLAVWRVGEKKPFKVLSRPAPPKRQKNTKPAAVRDYSDPVVTYPVATAFLDEHRIVSLGGDGKLVHWRINKDQDESASFKVLDDIGVKLWHRSWSWYAKPSQLQWDSKSQHVKLTYIHKERSKTIQRDIRWRLDLQATKAKRTTDESTDLLNKVENVGQYEKQMAQQFKQPISPDGKVQAIPQDNATIQLIDVKDEQKKTVGVLRLDG